MGTVKDRKVGATLVQEIETAKQANMNAKAFETSMTVDMIIAKYSKVAKPEVVKPTVKPEVVKPESKKAARKA